MSRSVPPDRPMTVILPGLGGSGDGHWQSRWETDDTRCPRISPSSWDDPDLDDWLSALDRTADGHRPLLVAHSLGCLLAIEWARRNPARAVGLFLVACPDPAAPTFPLPGSAFAAVDLSRRLTVPALIVASDDDGYCARDRSVRIATELGAGLVPLGPLGHINAESGLGDWQQGRQLLTAFAAGLGITRNGHG